MGPRGISNLDTLDSSILAPGAMSATPSPPPSPAPNFTNPYSIANGLNAVGILCTTLTTFTTAIRLYTKLYIIKTHGWEDYTMFIAWGGFIAYISLCHTDIIRYGAGTHQWDVPVTKIPAFAQLTHIIEILYHPLIAITKLSICLQFIRIFVVDHGKKFWCIQVFIFVNMFYYLARFFISIFQCKPTAKIWNPTLPGHCLNYQAYIFATGIFNVVSDILMLVFPLLCTWNLHMSFKRKLEVSAVFLVGGIALAASILRFIYSAINRGSHDVTFDLTRVGVSTAGELAAGILVGNLVVFPRFFSTCSSKFTRRFSTYLSGKSSNLQHHDANSSKISWPGTSNAQPPAPPWLDEHGASKIPGEYVELQDRRCEAVAFPSNSRDEICPIIIKNTTFTNNYEGRAPDLR